VHERIRHRVQVRKCLEKGDNLNGRTPDVDSKLQSGGLLHSIFFVLSNISQLFPATNRVRSE
jgi:hypothetical protein